jgi:hypothetical protein
VRRRIKTNPKVTAAGVVVGSIVALVLVNHYVPRSAGGVYLIVTVVLIVTASVLFSKRR